MELEHGVLAAAYHITKTAAARQDFSLARHGREELLRNRFVLSHKALHGVSQSAVAWAPEIPNYTLTPAVL